jgi:hypothetical protein
MLVAQTCRLLGVSRAGFYEAKRRAAKPTFCKASLHLRAAFMSSGQSYDSRRLVTALANNGHQLGRYKACRFDATCQPGAGMETQVRAHDQQQACPAHCAECACPTV